MTPESSSVIKDLLPNVSPAIIVPTIVALAIIRGAMQLQEGKRREREDEEHVFEVKSS